MTIALFSLQLIGDKAYGGGHYHLRKPVQHYLNIHIAGGEVSPFLSEVSAPTNTFLGSNFIAGAGAGARFGLSYEIRYHKFFFNLGAEIDGDFQTFKIGSFTDSIHNDWLPTKNHDATPAPIANTFMFQHTNFKESDYELRWAVPVQFGILFNSYFYGALGMKYSMSIKDAYYCTAETHMQTTMMLDNAISVDGKPIMVDQSSPQADLYGIYPARDYRFSSNDSIAAMEVFSPLQMLSPTLEIGARFPIAYRTVLRVGAFVEYGIPLKWEGGGAHVNYIRLFPENKDSAADTWRDPKHERTSDDLNVIFPNPVKNSDWTKKGYSTLFVGVRVTLSFNVTIPKRWCNCEADLGPRPIRFFGSGGRIEK